MRRSRILPQHLPTSYAQKDGRVIQQHVQQLLAEWREAERELNQTDDPDRIADLTDRIAQLRDAYQSRVASVELSTPAAEGEPA